MSQGIQIIDPEERFEVHMQEAVFTIRRIDSSTMLALERRHSAGSGGKESFLNDDVLDYILVDWQGISSPLGGSEVPCTKENKLHLPANVKLRIISAAQGNRAEISHSDQ